MVAVRKFVQASNLFSAFESLRAPKHSRSPCKTNKAQCNHHRGLCSIIVSRHSYVELEVQYQILMQYLIQRLREPLAGYQTSMKITLVRIFQCWQQLWPTYTYEPYPGVLQTSLKESEHWTPLTTLWLRICEERWRLQTDGMPNLPRTKSRSQKRQ